MQDFYFKWSIFRLCHWYCTFTQVVLFLPPLVCVLYVFVNEMFFRPVDDTRCVWESSLPLLLSSPTSSLAYISSINPVLGGLLWSLCVLWAMVIICPLRSHCFMRLVCSLRPVPLLSLLFTLYLARSYCLYTVLFSILNLSPLLSLITLQCFFFLAFYLLSSFPVISISLSRLHWYINIVICKAA